MNLKREIILGPPGTGKTTELINRLDRAFAAGVEPEEVAYLAFTKKAAAVAIQRSMKFFGFERKRFRYFRTIHSLAFHENKISSGDVMKTENYKVFGKEYGWDFTASYDNIDERPQYGHGLGDHLLRCYDLAKAKGITYEQEAVTGEYPFGPFAMEFFVKQFEGYKKKYGLLTFNDFLLQPVDLELKLVIIDEAQDLTHLQWSFLRSSFKKTPEILIAGDDDQCIYQWSGADLKFFLNIEAEITHLTKSHRCKRQIWNVCNGVSKRIGNRYEKHWEPENEGGMVQFERDPFQVDMSHGDWLILVRKNRFIRRYYHACLNSGRIFHDGSCWINQRPWFKGVRAYQKVARGEKITDVDAKNLLVVCPYAAKLGEYTEYVWTDFIWSFDGVPPWHEACTRLDIHHMAFMKKAIASGVDDLDGEGHVRLSTIHGAKGGEAENVLLDMRLDGVPLQQFKKDPDAERRVWYVGVSRAKTNLMLTGSVKNVAVNI